MGFETIKTVGPLGVGMAEPVVDGEQALELKPRRTTLSVAGAADKARPLQHLQVLGDGRLGQRRGLRQLDNAGCSSSEAFEDRSAGGVGKGCEHAAQGIVSRHYLKVI